MPIVLRAAHGDVVDEHRLLLESPTTVDLSGPATWVQPNLGGNGFYRSDLSRDLRTALATAPGATALERFVLVDDTWASFLGSQVERDDVVAVVRTMATTESDPSVWRRLSGVTTSLHALVPEADRASVAELACEIGVAPLARIDADIASGPTERSLDLRGVLFSLLGVVGDQAEVRAPGPRGVRRRSGRRSASGGSPRDRRSVGRCGGPRRDRATLARRSDAPGGDAVPVRARVDPGRGDVPTHPRAHPRRHPDPERSVRDPPRAGPPRSRCGGVGIRRDRWDELVARFPSNSHVRMLEGIRSVADRARATRIEAFLGDHPLEHGTKQITQHLERMWVSVRAAERLAQGPNVSPKE